MSTLTHSRLWQQSGRWDDAGPELFRLSDRRDNQLCLAPTCEGRSGQDEEIEVTLWARISKNLDCSIRPLARPLARSLASHYSLCSLARGTVNDWMAFFSVLQLITFLA